MGNWRACRQKSLFITLVALAAPVFAGCATKKPIPPPDTNLTTSAVVNNPDVEAADARVEYAVATRDRVGVGLLPEVTGGVDINETSPEQNQSRSDNSAAYASLAIPVSDVVSRARAVKAAEAGIGAAVSGYNNALQTALLDTVNASTEVRRHSDLVAARRTNLGNLYNFYDMSRKRQKAGAVSKADLEQIRLSISNAKAELNSSRTDLNAAITERDALLAGNPAFEIGMQKIQHYLPTSQQEAVSQSRDGNHQLRELEWRRSEAQENVFASQYKLLPKAVVSVRGNRYLGGTADTNEDVNVKFSLSVPLTKNLETAAEVRQNRARLQEIDGLSRAGTRDVAVKAKVAFQRYQAAVNSIQLYRASLNAARRALKGIRTANGIGAKTPSDELDARADLNKARINLINARFTQLTEAHNLLAQTGELAAAYGVGSMNGPVEASSDYAETAGGT